MTRAYALDTLQWYRKFQNAFDKNVVLDRHYLFDIETYTRISNLIVVDSHGNRMEDYSDDFLQLILVRDTEIPMNLNFRELPVALLRLHFTGRDRFTKWLNKIPVWDTKEILSMMKDDGYPDYRDTGDYHQQQEHIRAYFVMMIDMCFCSFERSLYHLTQIVTTNKNQWPSGRLLQTLENDDYWHNFPKPVEEEGGSHFIWLTCVWRIHVSRIMENLLKPWRDTEECETVCYRLKLFRSTHLDLLSAMVGTSCYNDATLVDNGVLYKKYPSAHRVCCAEELPCLVSYTFDNFKTGSNLKERCSLNDRIGHIVTNKPMPNICKVRNVHKIIRRYGNNDKVIFDLVKLISKCVLLGNLPHTKGSLNIMAEIIINRSFDDEVADTIHTTPRVKTQPLSPLEKKKLMKKKKGKKKKGKGRKKKKSGGESSSSSSHDDDDGDDDDGDDEDSKGDTYFTRWLYDRRHFVLSILKEELFYTAETSGCFNEVLGQNNKWLQHKEIVRAGMGRCRDEIARQCRVNSIDTPIDWTRIEYIYKQDKYDIKTGIIMNVHTLLLKTTEKVKKDSFENILMKKMTSIEGGIAFSTNDMKKDDGNTTNTTSTSTTTTTDDEYEEVVEEEGECINHLNFIRDGHITLDQLHFIAWTMAMSNKPIMETKWFQVVGMTYNGVMRLRDWIFCYYEYDIPDNALRKWITAFQRDSMNDYIILKTMIKLIIYYRKYHIFHFPSSYAVRQTHALRRILCREALDPTPPLLGVCYICPGCLRFANHVINPFDYDTPVNEKDVLIINHAPKCKEASFLNEQSTVGDDVIQIDDGDDDKPSSSSSSSSSSYEELEEDESIRYTNKKNKKGRRRKSKAMVKKMYANNEIMVETTTSDKSTKIEASIQHDRTQQQQQQNIPYFNTALYDMNTRTLHCQRNYKKKKALMIAHQTETNYVIMKSKRNNLVIESNIDRLSSNSSSLSPVDGNDGGAEDVLSLCGGDDDEDDDDDDNRIMTFNHEDELFFMPGDSLNFSEWDIANRLTHDLVDNHLHDTPTSSSSTTSNTASTKTTTSTHKMNDNKNVISKITGAAIHQRYTCATPLIPVDMIGTMINGKGFCVDCGLMTEVRNNNFHSHGLTCMRHATPSHPADHPVWTVDRFTVKHLERNAYLTEANENVTAGLEERDIALSAKRRFDQLCETPQYKNSKKPRLSECYIHPCDVIQYRGHDCDTVMCHFCSVSRAVLYIPTMDGLYKMSKQPICYSCKHVSKCLLSRNNVPFISEITRHITKNNRK